jgi:hypothetical protein
MKLSFLLFIATINLIQSQNFEGELNYSVKMDGFVISDSDTLPLKSKMIEKGDYFDSIHIKINDSGYIKEVNNGKNEKIILNFSEKKKFIITDRELTIDDLSFKNIYDRISGQNYSHNKIIELKQTDTIIQFNNLSTKASKILVRKKYSTEIYVICETFSKLPVKRNILIKEEDQVYDKEVEDLIGLNILLKYQMSSTFFGSINVEVDLQKIVEMEITSSNFEIPKYIEDKKLKKINKDSERFKFYKIVH